MPATKTTAAKSALKAPAAGKKSGTVAIAVPEGVKSPSQTTVGNKKGKATASQQGSATATGGPSLAEAIVDGLLKSGSSVVASLAHQVLAQYETDTSAALGTMISVLCRAAGVPYDVEASRVDDEGSIGTTLDEALAHAPAGATSYPLLNKDEKKFRKAFPALFERITELAYAADMLQDGIFLETLFPWASAMTESKARSFRHTATAAIYAMVGVLSDLVVRGDEAVSSAKTKKDVAAARERLEIVARRHKEMFDSTLHQRCKDTSVEIRLLSFQALRRLVMANPALHIANHYLKYLSIALNDKKSELRVEALDTIAQVLGNLPAHASRMRDFLKYFSQRIVELTADTETRVADMALKVAALIVKTEHDNASAEPVLTEESLDQVLVSIADDRRVIRTTAGTLLKMFIRCRVDTATGPRGRADTLCSFGSVLRTTFKESWAELYIVDAVWGESPPALLTEYKHFIAIAKDSDSDTARVATALNLLAAIMQRCRGPLELGPAAKDDLKTVCPATGDKAKVDENELLTKLTKDVCSILADILDAHGSADEVIAAAAAVIAAADIEQFAATRQTAQLQEALGALRRVTLTATEDAALEALSNAWRHVVLSESPNRTECEAQFQQLLRAVLKQARDAVEGKSTGRKAKASQSDGSSPLENSDTVAALRRLALVSPLASLTDHWGLLMNCLTRVATVSEGGLAHNANVCTAAEALVKTVHHALLWLVASYGEGAATNADVAGAINDATPKLMALAAVDAEGRLSALVVRGVAICAVADVVALPFAVAPVDQQQELIASASDAIEQHIDAIADATAALRDVIKSNGSAEVADATAAVTSARRVLTCLEASVTRIATSVSRLFIFDRMAVEGNAPRWMQLWPRVASVVKPAGDVFKTLFHALRDRAVGADASSLERQILSEGASRCEALGCNPSALEHLHQLGLKLSSMHFLPTDKFYPAALSVVKNAVEQASRDDQADVVLHAVAPYCARLRIADALAIVNGFAARPLFTAPIAEQSPFVRAFISAVRRAAKLEAAAAPAGAPTLDATPMRGSSVAAATVTRTAGRSAIGATTVSSTARRRNTQLEVDEEDDVLGEIVRTMKSTRQRVPPQPPAPDSKAWRGRGAAAAAPTAGPRSTQEPLSQGVRGRSVTQPPATQMTVSSMLDDQEVFIATQEWA